MKDICVARQFKQSWLFTVLVCVAVFTAGCGSSPKKSATGSAESKTHGDATTTSASTPTSKAQATTTTTTTTTKSSTWPGLSLLVEPQDGMTPIYNFMSSAKTTLDMTMYELSDATADQILISDHDRGVRVRVLLDRAYSGGSVNQAAYTALSAAGVSVGWTNDSEIFHQKTITVDGTESAIMTGNLTSEYYSTTRDFVVLDSQQGDVAAIESVFNADWSGASPSPGPGAMDLVWSPGSEAQLVSLIDSAQHSVVVENEEMDSEAIEDALESDASRGVTVTVVMTADSEWDSAFSQLESAGVHVALYPDTASALYIHAKVIDVDGTRAFVGSENFSTASLDYNRELGVITSSAAILSPLNSTLASDIAGGQTQQASNSTTPTTTAPASCYPIDDEGGCYEPGEYCRDDDHGMSGRAGDGQSISCEYDDGWYWETT
jgi:cardiolipin synthase A/B